MNPSSLEAVFTPDFCNLLLPEGIADRFFDAMYGDAADGAYNIHLEFVSAEGSRIELSFVLVQRPGKCLVCSLTYGLPTVFTRHPQINLKGIIKKITDAGVPVREFRLGSTREISATRHEIPLFLEIG